MEIIDHLIESIHTPLAQKSDTERQLEQEKKQLETVSLLPEEVREERIKGILNYCKGLYKTYKQKRLHSGKEMFVRQANSRINEIIRRANNKIIKLDKGIIELKNCTDYKSMEEIDAKMPTIW